MAQLPFTTQKRSALFCTSGSQRELKQDTASWTQNNTSIDTHQKTPLEYEDKAATARRKKDNSVILSGFAQQWRRGRSRGGSCLPSMSAPSSTSPIRSSPAEDSSANRESVLRSNARFSMPPFVGVLSEERGGQGEEMWGRRGGEKEDRQDEEIFYLDWLAKNNAFLIIVRTTFKTV